MGHRRQRTEPLEIEENNFAPMAEDDLQIRILIENPCQDQTDELDTSFVVPPQAECRKGGIDLVVEA